MASTADQVQTTAPAPPDTDRLERIEALIRSVQPSGGPPFDDSSNEVIRRRSAELATGKTASVPWSEVKRQAREATAG